MTPKDFWRNLSKEEKDNFLFISKTTPSKLSKDGTNLFNYTEAVFADEIVKNKLKEIYKLTNGEENTKIRIFDDLTAYPMSELIDKGFVFLTPSSDSSLNIKYISISKLGIKKAETHWQHIKRTITESKDFTLISISLISALLNIISTFYLYYLKFHPLIEEVIKK